MREEMTNLPESLELGSILAERHTCHQEGPWAQTKCRPSKTTWPETTPKRTPFPENLRPHRAEPFSWVPLPCCSPPGRPFPINPLAWSARVSPRTIHFPVSGPGRGSPFLQQKWNGSGRAKETAGTAGEGQWGRLQNGHKCPPCPPPPPCPTAPFPVPPHPPVLYASLQ